MKNLIREIEEFQRRFNFELESFLKKAKEIAEDTHHQTNKFKAIPEQKFTPRYATLKQYCEINPSFTQGGIRALIFNNNWNFEKEVIVRQGRKIMIDVQKMEIWISKPKHKSEKGCAYK